jgi:hypothetical protein
MDEQGRVGPEEQPFHQAEHGAGHDVADPRLALQHRPEKSHDAFDLGIVIQCQNVGKLIEDQQNVTAGWPCPRLGQVEGHLQEQVLVGSLLLEFLAKGVQVVREGPVVPPARSHQLKSRIIVTFDLGVRIVLDQPVENGADVLRGKGLGSEGQARQVDKGEGHRGFGLLEQVAAQELFEDQRLADAPESAQGQVLADALQE